MIPTLEELGIGFVPFSPIGRGFLTGAMDETTPFDASDFRSNLPRYTPEARRTNRALADLLAAAALRRGATPAQIALAWASGLKAVDRPDPRHHQACAAGGEHRRPGDRAHARRPARDRPSGGVHPCGRRAPPGAYRAHVGALGSRTSLPEHPVPERSGAPSLHHRLPCHASAQQEITDLSGALLRSAPISCNH